MQLKCLSHFYFLISNLQIVFRGILKMLEKQKKKKKHENIITIWDDPIKKVQHWKLNPKWNKNLLIKCLSDLCLGAMCHRLALCLSDLTYECECGCAMCHWTTSWTLCSTSLQRSWIYNWNVNGIMQHLVFVVNPP